MSALDTIRAATPLVRSVKLCLDGSLQTEYDELTTQLADAALADRDSLAADNTRAVVDAMEVIREKMQATEVTFSFVALPWIRRLALSGEHPPREGNTADKNTGHNNETYTVALIRASCSSVVGQDGEVIADIPEDVWATLLQNLNYQQVDTLFTAAQAANDYGTSVPPSARSLLSNPDSAVSLKSPGNGTRPRAASKGGSPRTPRKSSTTKPPAESPGT